MIPNLFQSGYFTLHSGKSSAWKIEADALTDSDWATLALMTLEIIPRFSKVIGVPRGGLKFANYLECYKGDEGPILIVDDVLTTGGSMENLRHILAQGWSTEESVFGYENFIGLVAFARGKCPNWIIPLFQFNGGA